jgi:hypothetical protein
VKFVDEEIPQFVDEKNQRKDVVGKKVLFSRTCNVHCGG